MRDHHLRHNGFRAVLFPLFLAACAAGVAPSGQAQSQDFRREGELVFAAPSGAVRAKIAIEIADTPVRRTTGLMYRDSLRDDQGMLFIFPRNELQSFWMKNTAFPLDIVFVNEEMEIVTIHRNTTPLSEESYPSSAPARFAVEVNAGFCRMHGIRTKDKVFWQRM